MKSHQAPQVLTGKNLSGKARSSKLLRSPCALGFGILNQVGPKVLTWIQSFVPVNGGSHSAPLCS